MMKLFQINRFQGRYSLLLLPITLWLSVNNAQANITCTASMNSGTVNIDNTITPFNVDNKKITGNLNYSCSNNGVSAAYASVHLGVDSGDSSTLNSHYMSGPNSSKLAFTMTLPNGELWGDGNGNGSEYHPTPFLIAPNETVTRSVVITTTLLSGYRNAYATEGVHLNNSYITLKYDSATDSRARLSYKNNDQAATQFPFTVQAKVVAECKIIAKPADINLGSISANQTNINDDGSINSSIGVTCTNTSSYTIGLTPSNNNPNGAGVMEGSGSNDKVPYQLRSTSGANGTIWGNTAGVAGIGNGAAQTQNIYVTVPSADFKPDNYSDTVTISVNY